MGYKTLYDALPFLKDVSKDRQEQFKEYFKTAAFVAVGCLSNY